MFVLSNSERILYQPHRSCYIKIIRYPGKIQILSTIDLQLLFQIVMVKLAPVHLDRICLLSIVGSRPFGWNERHLVFILGVSRFENLQISSGEDVDSTVSVFIVFNALIAFYELNQTARYIFYSNITTKLESVLFEPRLHCLNDL